MAWVAALVALALFARAHLRVSGDLRLFMPTPHTSAERLMLDEVSEGPATRILLAQLSGAPSQQLAQTSQRLAAALRGQSQFRLIANGEAHLEDLPAQLLPYRYLLSPTLDHARFDEPLLRRELQARERDLSSPAAALLTRWIARDPTLEILKLLQSWEPAREPRLIDDVWFNAKGTAALLILETAAPAFDPQAQRLTIERLRRTFERTRTSATIRLTVSGPGAFSVLMQARSEADARLAGIADTVGMILLMWLAYRRAAYVLLGALPLASAGAVALALVSALFGTVHGITIAFGFTLIGVALDYPIFLFSHQLPQSAAAQTARAIGPTLAIAVAGLCIAYLAFLASGVAGLAQLACFNIAGLATAGLATRFGLPQVLPRTHRDYGETALPGALARLHGRLPHPHWLAPLLALGALTVLLAVPGPLWDNDLSRLTPVPTALLLQYESLQRELGAPDVRYLLALEGASAQQVLEREERLSGALHELAARGAIAGFDDAARYLPSAATQERRRAALPNDAELRAALERASAGLAFRADAFTPFLQDVARARQLPPLTPSGLAGTPLELSVGSLLVPREGHWTGIVTFAGVHDPAALARLAAASGGELELLDLKSAAEQLIAHQRVRILWCLSGAAVLLALVVLLSLRSARRARRVLVPMALASLLTLAVLHGAGVRLNLFHLIALVLAAGLGLDYALFFERSTHDPGQQRRTLHALLVCATAACVVFAVLASSPLPVLESLGVTVVLGVISNFLLALLLIPVPSPANARQAAA